MSLSNMMEVFTKDSVDFSEANSSALGVQSRSSTSHSVRSDSQLSLECLPPEVPRYTGSGLPPAPLPSSDGSCSVGGAGSGPTSSRPHKDDPDDPPVAVHHHGWRAGNDEEDTCGEEPTSSQMLYDRIKQLSDRMHSHDLRFSLDSGHNSTHGNRRDDDGCTAGNSGDLILDHGLRCSSDPREDISSRNSTLVDETSLNISAEDKDAVLRDPDNKNSQAVVVYSEVNESPLSYTEEQQQLREDSENNASALGGDGEDRHFQHGSDKGGGSDGGGAQRKPHPPTDDIDPKLYKALEKMRKLDEKLANVTKKEREVKRQRKLLEQQLERMDSRFEDRSEDEDSVPTSPVFVTRLEDNSSSAGERSARMKATSTRKDSGSGSGSKGEESEDAAKEKQSSKKAQGEQNSIQGTNFIKRNIELASDAGALVSMTESEKKRLEELLCGDNELEDPYSGPAIVGAIEGEGFSYSKDDLDKMSSIDSQLQLMLPPSDWDSICSSTSRNTTPAASIFPQIQSDDPSPSHHTLTLDTISSAADDDGEGSLSLEPSITSDVVEEPKQIVPGEEVLHHFQMSREESKRLKDIEGRLLAIREENERMQQEPMVPGLAKVDLQSLLEQCTRELQHSSATAYDGPSTSETAIPSQNSGDRVTLKVVSYAREGDVQIQCQEDSSVDVAI